MRHSGQAQGIGQVHPSKTAAAALLLGHRVRLYSPGGFDHRVGHWGHAEWPQHPHALLASRALEHCPAARASLLSCPGCTARQSKGHARLPGAWSTTRKNSTCMQHKKHRCLFRSCTTCCIFAACTLSNAVAGRRPSAMFMQLPLPPQAHLPRPPLISIEYTLYPNGYRPQGPALARCGRGPAGCG